MKYTLSLLFCAGLLASAIAPSQHSFAQGWNVDRNHSQVGFTVTHFFTPVRGQFNDYEAAINFDPSNLAESSIDVTIQVASVSTGNDRRDNDVRSTSFFDAATYPVMTFKSNSIESTGENTFVAHGKLKIKDVEKDFDLPFTLLGMTSMRGKQIAGFESNTVIKRLDYGVGTGNWVATTVVRDEVEVGITLEVNRPEEE